MLSRKAAIHVKETAEHTSGENSRDLQTRECERYCDGHGIESTARYYDSPGSRLDFQRIMGDATTGGPPFEPTNAGAARASISKLAKCP